MSPELIGGIAFVVMMVLMFLGLPVGVCMILVAGVGIALLVGVDSASNALALAASYTVMDYNFAVLPIFILMGDIADISGMMVEAYKALNIWLAKIRGGLAMASVLGAAAFSTVSGSSVACAAIMTRVALPSLLDHKYDPGLSTGAIAAGGTLGNLIPPGIVLIIYAIITEVSLGKFFIACYIPGFLLTFMYLIQIYTQCRLNPKLGPNLGSTTGKEKVQATKGIIPVVAVLLIMLGGIQFGVFTPNEAASVITVAIFIYAVVRKKVNGQNLLGAFKTTLATTGMCFAILIGANIFTTFAAISQLPQALATWLISLNLSALGVIILIMFVYLVLGIPMDPLTILLLTLPIFLPVLIAYKIDLLWFGVLAIAQCELANLTPPVGMNLFVVAGMAKPMGIEMGTVFRGSVPFCITCAVFIVLLIAFPELSLFLVNQMK